MNVFVLLRMESFEADELIDICATFEIADAERRKRHDVPYEHDERYRIDEWSVKQK